MARDEKTTVKRVLKRNTLNILIVLVILLLIGAIVAGVITVLKLFEPSQAPSQQVETMDQLQTENQTPPEPDAAQAVELAPETPPEPGWQANGQFLPPFEGETKFLANQQLALTYDGQQLILTEQDGLYTLRYEGGGSTPRMDLQQIPSALDNLNEASQERLAIGILQAYYYVAPETEDISVSGVTRTENRYTAALSAPAYENAPAMEARICLMQAGSQFWYAAVLLPEDVDAAALEQAFDNLMIK